jgi:hypothetical protein
MSIHYTVLDQGRFVYARANGSLTTEMLVAHERRVLQDPRVQCGHKQLLDCRWIDEDHVDGRINLVLAELHDQYRARLSGSRYAVITYNAAWFRNGACDTAGSSDLTIIVFNDPRTACIWLGVDCEHLVPSGWADLPTALSQRRKMVEVPAD